MTSSRDTHKKRALPWPTALGRGRLSGFPSSLGTGEFFPLFSAISSISVRLSVVSQSSQGRQNSSRKKVASLPKCGHQFLSGYIASTRHRLIHLKIFLVSIPSIPQVLVCVCM